jgi:glycine oxidase
VSVAVVGGGIIGLSIASRLVDNGADVTIFDDGAQGAWNVAAGMLAPGGEAAFETPALVRLMSSSAERWPSFAASLGVDVGYDETGTLSLAVTADDVAVAAREWPSPALRPSRLRELEPALSPRVRAGVHRPADCQVDPRRVVAALRERLGDRIVAKRLSTLDEAGAPTVVVAAGCGTAALTGLPIRPVKGQVLRLRGEPGLLRHVLEATVDGRSVYVVPRADGEIVVGASVEEQGFDQQPRAGAVYELLRDAQSLVPELGEAVLAEISTGLRPGSPDNAPIIGPAGLPGLVYATGHYRNGILLTPITADAVAALLVDGELPASVQPFTPTRFEVAHA